MAGTRKPTPRKPAEKKPDSDVFRVVLIAPDRDALTRLLQKYNLDVGPTEVHKDSNAIEVTLFATQEQAARLRADDWKLEVHENLSEIGRSRQKEVAKGDRFEGGKIAPKGLGKKTRQEG